MPSSPCFGRQLVPTMVLKRVNEIRILVEVGRVCLYGDIRPFDAYIVEISGDVD